MVDSCIKEVDYLEQVIDKLSKVRCEQPAHASRATITAMLENVALLLLSQDVANLNSENKTAISDEEKVFKNLSMNMRFVHV